MNTKEYTLSDEDIDTISNYLDKCHRECKKINIIKITLILFLPYLIIFWVLFASLFATVWGTASMSEVSLAQSLVIFLLSVASSIGLGIYCGVLFNASRPVYRCENCGALVAKKEKLCPHCLQPSPTYQRFTKSGLVAMKKKAVLVPIATADNEVNESDCNKVAKTKKPKKAKKERNQDNQVKTGFSFSDIPNLISVLNDYFGAFLTFVVTIVAVCIISNLKGFEVWEFIYTGIIIVLLIGFIRSYIKDGKDSAFLISIEFVFFFFCLGYFLSIFLGGWTIPVSWIVSFIFMLISARTWSW